MIAKIFEVRDNGTHIEVFALSTAPSSADPYFWTGRTMPVAHKYITEHFVEMKDGDVVDVRFILGETSEPCQSDRHYSFNPA